MSNKYYDYDKFETIEVIEQVANNDNISRTQAYNVATAIKYLLRLGRKSENIEDDLFKAENYIHRARTGEFIQ